MRRVSPPCSVLADRGTGCSVFFQTVGPIGPDVRGQNRSMVEP